MATRGPRPLPSAQKRLRGTDQKCRRNPDEPPAIPGEPQPPEFLDDLARAEWERLVPELRVRGLLESVDLAVITTYCTAWSQLAHAEAALRIEGPVVLDSYGRFLASPHARLAAAARGQLIAACRELGLSPSARTTVRANAVAAPATDARVELLWGVRNGAGGK